VHVGRPEEGRGRDSPARAMCAELVGALRPSARLREPPLWRGPRCSKPPPPCPPASWRSSRLGGEAQLRGAPVAGGPCVMGSPCYVEPLVKKKPPLEGPPPCREAPAPPQARAHRGQGLDAGGDGGTGSGSGRTRVCPSARRHVPTSYAGTERSRGIRRPSGGAGHGPPHPKGKTPLRDLTPLCTGDPRTVQRLRPQVRWDLPPLMSSVCPRSRA